MRGTGEGVGSGARRAAHRTTDHIILMEGRTMSAMKSGLVMVLALAVSGAAYPLSAQRGIAGGGLGLYGLGPRLGQNVEFALQYQADLGLTGEQIASLQELQVGIQQDVEPREAEIEALRSQIVAGEVNQTDGLVQLQQLLGQFQTAAAPYRTGVTTILTADQHLRLQDIMWSTGGVQGQYLGGAGYGQGQYLGRAGVGLGVGRGMVRGAGRGVGLGAGRGVARGGRFQQRLPARGRHRMMRVPLHRNRIIRRGGGGDDPSLW